MGALGGRLGAISAFLEGAIFEVAFHTPPGPIWEAIWVPVKVHFEPPKGLETRSGAPVHFHQKYFSFPGLPNIPFKRVCLKPSLPTHSGRREQGRPEADLGPNLGPPEAPESGPNRLPKALDFQ